jgi:hypothetical protein
VKKAVVQGLYAQGIAGQQEFIASSIPDREGKYSVQPSEHCAYVGPRSLRTFGGVQVQQHFRVRVTAKCMTRRLQLFSQFTMVIYLAIIHEDDTSVIAQHRLMAQGRKILNRQSAVYQANASGIVLEYSSPVRATMLQGVQHLRQLDRFECSPGGKGYAGNATHMLFGVVFM